MILATLLLITNCPHNGAWVVASALEVSRTHWGPRPALCGLSGAPLMDQGPAPRVRMLLTEDTIDVPRGEWRSADFAIKQAALVECAFRVAAGGPVRIALLSREQAERLRKGVGHEFVRGHAALKSGVLRLDVPPGEYEVIIQNDVEPRPAQVDIRVWVAFPGGQRVAVLTPGRRIAIVGLSSAMFLAIAVFAGTRLIRAGVFDRRGW